jgi:sulfate adenylyltransferase
VIESAGFSSPTDFIVFVLRDLLGEAEKKNHESRRRDDRYGEPQHEDFSAHDLETVKQKLRNLATSDPPVVRTTLSARDQEKESDDRTARWTSDQPRRRRGERDRAARPRAEAPKIVPQRARDGGRRHDRRRRHEPARRLHVEGGLRDRRREAPPAARPALDDPDRARVKPGTSDEQYKEGQDVALETADGQLLAVLHVESKWQMDKGNEARKVLRTDDKAHPGVQYLDSLGDWYLGGRISVLNRLKYENYNQRRLDPVETRTLFKQKGWKTIVAFQTRNPIHRAHEYLTKVALEVVDGLMLHPLMGDTKSDDVPAAVRMQCYETLLASYYPKERTCLVVYPQAMRYGGPSEAVLHAIVRKNYGCTHFIVGRDHAGVGNYYGSYDAQAIFDEYAPGEVGINLLKFENSFWCKRTGGMASTKSSPATAEERVMLSGTQVREMLRNGVMPPQEFSRPEVAKILIDAMRAK